jgi:flagellar biosynthesis chaperone FliJ
MNPKRRFRLETVLRVARLREKQAEKDIAIRLRDEQKAEAEVLERTAVFESSRVADAADGATFASEASISRLRAGGVLSAEDARARAVDQLTAARDEWLRAARHRRSVDELKERHHAAHAMVAAQAAQRSLDDLARRRKAES